MENHTLESMAEYFFNQDLLQIIVSNPVKNGRLRQVRIRPLMLRGKLMFQVEEQAGVQVFHKNLKDAELTVYLREILSGSFRQAELTSFLGTATVLVSKKGKMTVKLRRKLKEIPDTTRQTRPELVHNRKKRYLLPEGVPVPFLVDLGVMTPEGMIVRSRYDKYRQINRFLEFIEDVVPALDKNRETVILDFGCEKSYLTFAMYYYLHEQKGYPIRIIGLDLKKDVIIRCSRLAEEYGYDKLNFLCGDIAEYEGINHVDMVVTLHACDTATDYALAKAVRWGAKIILSVPCCQHELNAQIQNPLMEPIFEYGLIKERMAALYTDAIRAQILENCGYRSQILEFIDMEHTPKNILIRAVFDGTLRVNRRKLDDLMGFLSVKPTLAQLLLDEPDQTVQYKVSENLPISDAAANCQS